MPATRPRAFCRYCGAITTRRPEPDGRYSCAAHKDLRDELEQLPPDPARAAPTTAAQAVEAIQAARETRP